MTNALPDPVKWQWYSGRAEEIMQYGPFDTKEEAVQEAMDHCCFEEIEPDEDSPDWRAGVFVIEARGSEYDCDHCGVVRRACDKCCEQFRGDPDRVVFEFKQVRNVDYVVLEHPYDE